MATLAGLVKGGHTATLANLFLLIGNAVATCNTIAVSGDERNTMPEPRGRIRLHTILPPMRGQPGNTKQQERGKEMNDTKTELTAWNGETYKGAAELWDTFKGGEFAQYTEDLDPDELLRLALFAWNSGVSFVPEDLPALIAEEQGAYYGEGNDTAEFTREFLEMTDAIPEGFPDWVVIDYQTTWQANLRHDFFSYEVIDVDGDWRKFYWRSF